MNDKQEIDPELVDDREANETDHTTVDLLEYDGSQFELGEDFEYVEEDDDDGSEDED